MPATRLYPGNDPFSEHREQVEPWHHRRGWPGDWIAPAQDADERPAVWRYACAFTLPSAAGITIHASGDERYRLFLDGVEIGAGPERCSPERWAYESWRLDLAPGDHRLEAVVWSAGPAAPWPQTAVRHGFLCVAGEAAHHALVTTGRAAWRVRRILGIAHHGITYGCGAGWIIDLAAGEGLWQEVVPVEPGIDAGVTYCREPRHLLRPALLPAQAHGAAEAAVVLVDDGASARCDPAGDLPAEHAGWTALLAGRGPLTVPAGLRRRVLLDLGCYRCGHLELTISGAGGTVAVTYGEGMLLPGQPAGTPLGSLTRARRDAWRGLELRGVTDRFTAAAGPRPAEPLWWRAGRWVALEVQAAAAPLTIHACAYRTTGYPLVVAAEWQEDGMRAACLRTALACLHETYMDCPFHEQLQYVGDTRIQALITLALARDERPVRAAIAHIIASSANQTGQVTSCHPAAGGQVIPTFALIAIGMVHDLAQWRSVGADLRAWLPTLRGIIERFALARGADGLARSLPGWNFIDAEGPGMRWGIPPGGQRGGISTAINCLAIHACRQLADLERLADEPELAARWTRLADGWTGAVQAACWDAVDGVMRDVPGAGGSAGPHTTILALLAGAVPAAHRARLADGLCADAAAVPVGIMFAHYLCEVAVACGHGEALRSLWRRWHAAVAEGFTTFPENWGHTRSDCHAWGAHPLYHHLASEAGIRPAAPGFAAVALAPLPAEGATLSAAVPHPGGGRIAVRWMRQGDRLDGTVALPAGIPAIVHWQGRSVALPAAGQPTEHRVVLNAG